MGATQVFDLKHSHRWAKRTYQLSILVINLTHLRPSDAYISQLTIMLSLVQIMSCRLLANCTIRKKNQWNLIWNSKVFIQENAYQTVIVKHAGNFDSLNVLIKILPWWEIFSQNSKNRASKWRVFWGFVRNMPLTGKSIIIVNRFSYINSNDTKSTCTIHTDMKITITPPPPPPPHEFSMQSTLDKHGLSVYSGYYSSPDDFLCIPVIIVALTTFCVFRLL